jgi:LysR family hydrogen peroxide-inducible transcriptional activator
MELHEVRYFLSLCDTLNFRRAAERCHVTQPALTRAIQKLENEFGGLLFIRDRQPMQLSELGRLIRPQMQEILHRTETVKLTAKQLLMLDGAPLRLGVMCTVGPRLFTGFLNDFHTANPGIEATLHDGPPRRLSELLLDGEIDVAVMAQPEPFLDGLTARPLYRERFNVAFGLGHPFEAKPAIRLADMDGQVYLRRLNCEFREYFSQLLQSRGFSLKISYQSDREDWVQSLVAGGLGVCFLPEHLGIAPGLRTRPLVEPAVSRVISLVTVSGRRHSPAVARLVRAAAGYAWPGTSDVDDDATSATADPPSFHGATRDRGYQPDAEAGRRDAVGIPAALA